MKGIFRNPFSLAGKKVVEPSSAVHDFVVKWNDVLQQFEYQDLRVSALFKYSATNYNDLLTKTGMVANDIALVLNSQGVLWINYKGSGFYIYDGTNWVSDKQAISDQFNTTLADILAIEGQITSINSQLTAINTELNKKANFDEVSSTSLIWSDGVLEINSLDNTKFDVPAGKAVFVDNSVYPITRTLVEWDAFTAQTTPFLGVSPNTFIAISKTGTLVLTQELQSIHDTPDVVIYGWLEHLQGTVIERRGTEPYYNVGLGQQFQQHLESTGAYNVEGNLVSANGNNLKLNISAGLISDNGLGFEQNIKSPNFYISNQISEVEFRYFYQDGLGDWVNTTALTGTVNPDVYDDGSGTLSSIPSGKWSIQRVYYYAPFGYLDIYYSQGFYNSKDEAINAFLTESFKYNPYLDYDIPIAVIFVKHGTTNLSNTNDCEIRPVSKNNLGGISLGGGESNTVSNVGTSGIGLFKQKVGVDLEFKNLKANSAKIAITEDTVNNTVNIDANITKSDVGLSNVDNTADVDKPLGNTDLSFGAKSPTILDAGKSYVYDGNEVVLRNIGDTYEIVSTLSGLNTLTYNSSKTQVYIGSTSGKITSLGDATGYDDLKEFVFVNNADETVEITYSDFTTAYRLEPKCRLTAYLLSGGTANGEWHFNIQYPDFLSRFEDYFIAGTGTGQTNWVQANGSLGSASLSFPTGFLQLTTSTTATGVGYILKPSSGILISSGTGVMVYESSILIPTLSDGTNNFRVYAGFGDVITNGPHTDCVCFKYQDTVSTNFLMESASNNSRTTTPTSIPVVANTIYKLRIEVNNIGTRADFFINGANVGNLTTNLPIGAARQFGIVNKIEKTVGTTARTLQTSYVKFRKYTLN